MKDRQYTTKELFRRFQPYFKPYWKTLVLDLFCAGLTTLCELVLPMIMRYITNQGLYHLAELSVQTILGVVAIYLALRVVDCVATYYMAGVGHIMGAKIETDMRRDAYQHLHQLSNTYYNNTKVGQIMGRITNDLFDVTEFAHHCPEEFFIAGVKLVIARRSPGNVMGLMPCLTSSIASSSKQVRSFCLKIPVASTASGLST